ncbi:hypothetical protein [Weizmannia acidilactici]|uniref:hypothetical protein n=1 Tax=Weizmannia acidilactici TaxID=2607726 RepID=UPI003530D6D9
MSIYDYPFERLTGNKEESLSNYKNQVLLIVNTASKCVFTPQYVHRRQMPSFHMVRRLPPQSNPGNGASC